MRTNRQQAVIIYNGLDVNCEITSVDPLDQVFYAGSNTYIPNRSLTPLVLIPKLEIMNIDGVKVATEFTKTSWYLGEIKTDNLITSKITTDDFYLDGLNLVVKKNLTTPLQVSFLGEFLDKRTNKTIQVPRVVELSISSSNEVAPAPTIGIDRPADWAFNPIKDSNLQTLTASVFVNEKAYASAAHWLVEHNGQKEPIELFNCYVSGQHTHQLVVDTSRLPSGALIHAENVSEADYNKAYGINPDWDDRMSEVFENRNLFSDKNKIIINAFVGYDIPGDGGTVLRMMSNRRSVVIPITENKSYSIQYEKLNSKNRFSFGFYSQYEQNENSSKAGWFDWSDNSIKKFENFIAPTGSKYLIIYYGWDDNDFIPQKLKVEQSPIATPYTPAPEDLNFRNYVLNSDYSKIRTNIYFPSGWSVTSNATAELIDEGSSKSIKFTAKIGGNVGSNRLSIPCDRDWKNLGIYPVFIFDCKVENEDSTLQISIDGGGTFNTKIAKGVYKTYIVDTKIKATTKMSGAVFHPLKANTTFFIKNVRMASVYPSPTLQLSPYDYAPDGIIPGEYTTSIPFFVKYPTLDVDVEPFGDIIEGQTDLKVNAIVEYNKGRIANPSQFLDMKFIIIDDDDNEEVAGTGNSVTIATARLTGNKSIVLDWDFKKRPTTLTKI